MKRIIVMVFISLSVLLTGNAVWANHEPAGKDGTGSAASVLSDGEVRKVDMETKKITVRHGPLTNLDMPAMTMVFQVADIAMLATVKAGDKVKFLAEKQGGAFTIVHLEPLK